MSSDQLKALVIEKLIYESDEATLLGVLNLLSDHGPPMVVLSLWDNRRRPEERPFS